MPVDSDSAIAWHRAQLKKLRETLRAIESARFTVGESVQAHQELQARGGPSELLLLPGEGHTIVGRDHLVELSERVAAWFHRWL